MVNIENSIDTIGSIIVNAINQDFLNKTNGNFDINDYVNDYDGSQYELNVQLIKLAAKLL